MEIFILREGKETGPFTEEITQNMLKQGSVLINDLAWQPGMANWLPLHSVLYPGPLPTTSQRPPPPPAEALAAAAAPVKQAPPADPATAKQKAFLTYIGIPFTAGMTKEQAALAANDAMENPKDPTRLARWNNERLRLHPELFAAEIKAKKENRANHFHEIAVREGAGFFHNVTKAHAQVLVSYLDVHHPNWDANEAEATRSYFFPAIAEKFPPLVDKTAKGKFKFGTGPKVAAEVSNHASVPKPAGRPLPVGAIVRGLVIGGVVLAAVYFGPGLMKKMNDAQKAEAVRSAEVIAAHKAETKSEPAPAVPATTAPKIAAATSQTPPANTPETPAMAALPGTEPALGDPAMTAPAASVELAPVTPTPAVAEPLPVQPKTTFMITKSTEVALTFGRAVLRPGTLIKIVAIDGTRLKIKYGNDVVVVPMSATDYQTPGAQPAAPAPVALDPFAPPPAVATPAPGVKPPASLF